MTCVKGDAVEEEWSRAGSSLACSCESATLGGGDTGQLHTPCLASQRPSAQNRTRGLYSLPPTTPCLECLP